MNTTYSEISITTLASMRVATYQIKSQTPENDVVNFLEKWAASQKFPQDFNSRNFGFDAPVNEKEANQGIRGYEYWITIPETIQETQGVKIINVPSDTYATLRIFDAFSNPFELIPNGWKKLQEWVKNQKLMPECSNQKRYWLEEVIKTEKNPDLLIYFPIKKNL